ncbi:nucleotide exchange factor GrpE [Actinokineospora sp. NBRC 105648]|uniref:nucleotide exchange factor GrpE n=1 Tax=Actinokineospora sp. NBRC 105648 TaxID=3032206 RepID=UPI0024A18D20|nr:nucleotide exchange factor GrpE [Actinokineospora sp. NBRC 105648]GLZ42333.1 hypothetical protein Acsp05_59570 [Actinokineospora sp. NBRC 105648]
MDAVSELDNVVDPAPPSNSGEAPDHSTEHSAVAELARSVADLAEQARGYQARAAARERVIDNLHAEVERLRVGEQALLLRPLVIDLQKLRDDLLRQARGLPTDIGPEQVGALLESFALSVEQALERCGSVPVRPAVGDPFAPRAHRAVRALPAPSAAQDATVAEVVSDGYLDVAAERVTTAARVHVWRWEPPADQDEQPQDEQRRDDENRDDQNRDDARQHDQQRQAERSNAEGTTGD